jgi:ribonuclease HI
MDGAQLRNLGEVPKSPWLVYCDGAWGAVGAGALDILISPSGIKPCYPAGLQFSNKADKCTNNITEYDAILLGLQKLRSIGARDAPSAQIPKWLPDR